MHSIEVAAGLLFRKGRLLITQRKPGSHLGGLWEFPGGKRESGEPFEQALQRELNEELGVVVSVGELLDTVEHSYPEKRVLIRFYVCHLLEGEPKPLDCHDLRWVQQFELSQFKFPEADAHLLTRLASEDRFWTSN